MSTVGNKKQRGLALITVLMILAIMVTVAATMTGRLTLGLKRTEGMIFSQKVYWYGQAAADLGRLILNNDFANSNVNSLDQIWATPDMVFPLDNGHIAGQIKDFRSCFNINALAQSPQSGNSNVAVKQFQTLLEAIGLNNNSAQVIAQSTRDWIDKNSQVDGAQGAEDSFYQGLSIAHLAANNLMVDISELRAVQGVDKDIYEKVVPYLCALPSREQKINVNTVSIEQPEILYALFKTYHNLSTADFKTLLQARPLSGWNNINDFFSSSLLAPLNISSTLKNQLSVSSDFFQLSGVAEFEGRLLALKFLFQIQAKKAKLIRYQTGGFNEL
ncbi:MAG: type II secretion system minor pseudopilin GspK [Psychromonas sp.]|nr:type II secretion system minor pseudopilin GspK [Psychromonas sp.]